MINSVLGVILSLAILSALINGALDGDRLISVVLWTGSGLMILVMLARAYVIGTELDKLGKEDRKHMVRAHVLLHVVPLTYFPIAYAVVKGSVLETIYLIPVVTFFITGVWTWNLCHRLFGTGLYSLFRVGNLLMLVFFPVAFVSDMAGWPAEDAEAFWNLMRMYFIVHFMLTGITIPLMERDLRRYLAGSPVQSNSDAAP